MAYNTLAEIPGTDRNGEIVMVGAHLDSWHGGTGATDNAAGCAVVMEAVRILQALGVKPKRTIRVALWTGEEQGLFGSRAYVAEHFGSWSGPEDPERRKWLSAVELEGRGQAHHPSRSTGSSPPTSTWTTAPARSAASTPRRTPRCGRSSRPGSRPFHDLGADTVTLRRTGGTDHVPFDGRGPARLPVHPGRAGLHDAHPPFEPGRLRPPAEGGPDAGLGGDGLVPLSRGHAAGAAAAEVHAEGGTHSSAAIASNSVCASARSDLRRSRIIRRKCSSPLPTGRIR